MRLLVTLALTLFSVLSHAEQYCFNSDAVNPALQSQWTHHSIVLWGSKPRVSHNGTVQMSLTGYGYNDAEKPGGGTDLVPIVGAAVKDVTGEWVISLSGTLLQYSTIGYITGASFTNPIYYTISLWWSLSSVDLVGHGHMGNITAPFEPHIPGVVDDTYATLVWPVDCSLLR